MLMPHRGYLATYPIPPVAIEGSPASEPRAGGSPVSKTGDETKSEPGAESADWESALLEELIYERVRLNVDLLELVDFERELSASIERALAACGAREDRDRLANEHLERAWARVEREWREARATDDDPLQCPLCGDLQGPGD